MFWIVLYWIVACVIICGLGIAAIVCLIEITEGWEYFFGALASILALAGVLTFLISTNNWGADQRYHCGEGTRYTTFNYVQDGDTYTDFQCVAN